MERAYLMDGRTVAEPVEDFTSDGLRAQPYDVIVVGLGTAGATAAIVAAREGLRVLGLERSTSMGGTGTGGAVFGYYYGSRGGMYEEIDTKVRALAAADVFAASRSVKPAEAKKLVLEADAAAVDVRYEARLSAVFRGGLRALGVEWIDATGIQVAGCRVLIDATGEAEACAAAGCPLLPIGRSFDGAPQPFSNVRVVVTHSGLVRNQYNDDGVLDPTHTRELAAAVLETTRHHLRERFEDEERLLYVAPQLGVREGRCIAGEEIVTFSDFSHGTGVSHPVMYAHSNFDNHGKDVAFESEAHQDWEVAASLWGVTASIPIPYGALIPRGWDGVVAAGRCLSVDHDAACAVRQQRDMQILGEVAAHAAILSIRRDTELRDVPYDALRTRLAAAGIDPNSQNQGMHDVIARFDVLTRPFEWMTSHSEILNALAGVRPGIAIWSAYRLGSLVEGADRFRAALREWVACAADVPRSIRIRPVVNVARHGAFALALLGDPAALPVLRTAVEEGDTFCPDSSRRHSHARGYAAVYLLGRMRDAGAWPALAAIVDDPGAYITRVWGSVESIDAGSDARNDANFIDDYDELEFQYVSHAIVALLKIAAAHSGERKAIATRLARRLELPGFSLRNRLRGLTAGADRRTTCNVTNVIRIACAKTLDVWGVAHDLYNVLAASTLDAREQRLLAEAPPPLLARDRAAGAHEAAVR